MNIRKGDIIRFSVVKNEKGLGLAIGFGWKNKRRIVYIEGGSWVYRDEIWCVTRKGKDKNANDS